jgi:arginine exporter protein ArgO
MIIEKRKPYHLIIMIIGLIFLWILPVAAAETEVKTDSATKQTAQKKNMETMEEMVVTGTRSEEKIT